MDSWEVAAALLSAAPGLATAGYVPCDAQSVRHAGSPLACGFVVSATD